jgi:hypothetical protein
MSSRLWLLLVFALASVFAPSRTCAYAAETRTGDFLSEVNEVRPESAAQVADSHLANTVFGYETVSGYALAAESAPALEQLEFPFAKGASVQTPGVTVEGETFVRVGASPVNLKFGATPGGIQPGTYAFPEATFNAIGEDPAALKNFGDLPGAPPQYYRILSPPAGTPIQRGIVPGGQFGGVGGVPEIIFPNGF